MTRLLTTSVIIALIAAGILSGCGGGGDDGEPPIPPVTAKATVRGVVVRAEEPSIGIGGATIQAVSTTGTAGVGTAQGTVLAETVADGQGNYVLRNIPVGNVTIVADTPGETYYGSQTIPNLTLVANDNINLTITILPLSAGSPARVSLTPAQGTTDLNGQIRFAGVVSSATGVLSVTPSYYLSGAIGSVDRNGVFYATRAGTGQLTAACGDARATANITVTPPRPPQITSFFVTPTELNATGGKVSVTVAANDGDGIAQVKVEVYRPDSSVQNVIMELDPRTTETYQLPDQADPFNVVGRWLIIPANTNTPDGTGFQEPQRYSIRVVALDNSGASTSTNFVDVTVKGLDQPPFPNPF